MTPTTTPTDTTSAGPADAHKPDELRPEPDTDSGPEPTGAHPEPTNIDSESTELEDGESNEPDDSESTEPDDADESGEPNKDRPSGNPSGKRMLMLAGGAVFLLGLAGFGILGGFFSDPTTQPAVADKSDGGASALAPPEARPQPLDPRQKYDKYGYDGATLTPNLSAADRQAASGTQLLTGKDPSVSRGSNEHLTETDLRAVGTVPGTASDYRTAGEQKTLRRSQLNRQFDHQEADRDRIYSTLRRSPKSREQVADERADRQERDLDRRTAETLLRQVELANQRMGNPSPNAPDAGTNPDALNMADYNRLKAMHGGRLPPSYQPYFSREIAYEQAGTRAEPTGPTVPGPAVPATTVLPGRDRTDGSRRGTARKAMNLGNADLGNGFYGLTQPGAIASIAHAGPQPSIPAVIHGEGQAIRVRAGSLVKIRLLEETRIVVKGETLVLPAHTLLTGTCSIGTDRLRVSVNTLRIGASIYPIMLTVYDIDGLAGLSVPNLADKNRLTQGLAQTGQQAISSPAYFIPQGSFGQQVGGQLAMQTTNTLFQGVRSLAQAKLAAVQVTIKPNYRIFLKSDAAAPAGADPFQN